MIRYAGHDLLSDPTGELQAVRERVRMDRLALFGPSVRSMEDSIGQAQPRCRLPDPNYPAAPALALNRLYWPTGATRWASFVGIADRVTLDKILEATGSVSGRVHEPTQFVIGPADFDTAIALDNTTGFQTDSVGRIAIATEMYLLPPRPVVLTNPQPDDPVKDAWLLPLVDVRYFWRWKALAAKLDGESRLDPDLETWDGWIDVLNEALQITLDLPTDIPAEYFSPDKTSLNLLKHNAAQILEAVAHSCGRRVVRNYDGTVTLMDPATAASIHVENTSLSKGSWIGGGPATLTDETVSPTTTPEFFGHHDAVPAYVDVVFRKLVEYADPEDADDTIATAAPFDQAKAIYGPGTRTIRNAGADLTDIELSRLVYSYAQTIRTPSWVGRVFFNATGAACDEPLGAIDELFYGDRYFRLAAQISSDWYAWRRQFDHASHGIHEWTPTGFDDCQVIDASESTLRHRITTLPHDFGVESQLVQVHRQADFDPRQAIAIVDEEWELHPSGLAPDTADPCASLTVAIGSQGNVWNDTWQWVETRARPLIPTDPHAHEDSLQYDRAMVDSGEPITIVSRSKALIAQVAAGDGTIPVGIVYLRYDGAEWQVIEYDQEGGSGSGSVSIWFVIDDVVCDEITGERYIVVTPHRIAPPCETVPGADEYGLINVYDDGFLCILNQYTDEELLGLRGEATYASDIGGTCVASWTLEDLCDAGEY